MKDEGRKQLTVTRNPFEIVQILFVFRLWSFVGRQPQHGVAQRPAHAVEDGCLEQKCLAVGRLLLEHIVGQIREDLPLAAIEPFE